MNNYDRRFRLWVEDRFARAGEQEKGKQLGLKIANNAFQSGFADASQSHLQSVEGVRRAMLDLAARMYDCYQKEDNVNLVGSEESELQNEWELLQYLALYCK